MIREITDREEKLSIMKACDDAYTISVIGRKNFDSLFDKIDKYAVFLGVYNSYGQGIGYSAFYANDEITRRSFLSLICISKKDQNDGKGGRLLDESISIAKDKGMKSMGLNVLKKDIMAIEFYIKHGFKVLAEADEFFLLMERTI